jgi:ubiquitin C-terminal hydrolase
VYKNELNPDNPLGMNGQVAEAFGALIERLWSSSGGSAAPREFKQALSKFAPSFSGYGQQDTQELLAFLLDGTHEDLNRIKKKPATNAPDWNGGSDAEMVELAKICWEQYRSRNDSVIVDLFQGQYRSTVVCPDCAKVGRSRLRDEDSILILSSSGLHHVRPLHVYHDEPADREEVEWDRLLCPARHVQADLLCTSPPMGETCRD